MLVRSISYLVCIYGAFTTCQLYLISFDIHNTLWETHYYYLHFQDEKTEIWHKENSLCSMAIGFQEQDKPSLFVPCKKENTLLIFQCYLPCTFDFQVSQHSLQELPISLSVPLSLQLQLCRHCMLSVPSWPTYPQFTCSLLSGYVFLYQALGMGPPVFLSPSGLYFLFPSYLQKLHCSLDLNCSGIDSKLEPQTVALTEERDFHLLPPHPSMVRTPPTAFCLSYSMPETHLLPSNFLSASFPTV